MSLIPAALATATALGVAGAPAGLVLPKRVRGWVAGVLTAGVGVAGGASGVAALGGSRWSAEIPGLLPLAGTHLAVDALSGLFMAVAGAVVAAVAVYGVGYVAGHGSYGLGSRGAQAVLPLFALTLLLVPAAASVSTFLLLWELMALTSLLLVLAEHRARPAVAVLAESGRLPVDNPSTHLELTMAHEAMVLEYAGPDLALVEFGAQLRLTVLLGLLASLFAPWGIATGASLAAVLLALLLVVLKVMVLGMALAAAEVFWAKLRLFRVPELLAGSFLLALLAVTASYFLGGE
ncbi:formate hydrogenlyase [Streptomyces mirabilis]|uniref:formate hydrogenlyase n=1 Tax=Streptomyces mirabilis TaxID=68239 RepID=UPI0036AD584D